MNYAVVKLHEFHRRYVDRKATSKSPIDSTMELLHEEWPLGKVNQPQQLLAFPQICSL